MKPGDFALRSKQSRAAARRLLEQRQRSVERIEVILGCDWSDVPRATEWRKDEKDGVFGRVVSIPVGMTLAEGLRSLSGYSADELKRIATESPEPLDVFSMYSLRRL